MIARIWRGFTREADKDTYFAYLQETGLKEYAAIPGNRGVWTLRRVAEGKCEFTLISLWDSMEASRPSPVQIPRKPSSIPRTTSSWSSAAPAFSTMRFYQVLQSNVAPVT